MQNERFTKNYHTTLSQAYILATNQDHKVDLGYVLLGMMSLHGSLGSEILKKARLTPKNIKVTDTQADPSDPDNYFTQEVLAAIETSMLIAYEQNHSYIGTEHLLAAILNDETITKIIRAKKLLTRVQEKTKTILKSTAKFPEVTQSFNTAPEPQIANLLDEQNIKHLNLDNFVVDLTDPEIQKNIDPVIGREQEIDRLINILGRRSKNNPILLGEPGVGKTAIVEGLAKRIIEHDVPDFLITKKILSLDLTSLVSGTMYRGEFESRLKQVLDEVTANPHIILFIDEVHNLIGTGATSGSMDAANILKPALARGQIRCIGATTYDEYKKYIEKDSALERRFQSIHVHEPSPEESITIIKGIKHNYENYHHVTIPDALIQQAVELSNRYITHHRLPDKAIDILDESAAQCAIKNSNSGILKQIKKLKHNIVTLHEEKHQAILDEDFNLAQNIKEKENDALQKLTLLKNKHTELRNTDRHTVTLDDILHTISIKTKIPLQKLQKKEHHQLLHLEKLLEKNIIGQRHVIEHISNHLRKSKVGIRNHNRPIGSFIFLGPSGVGKTELSKVLAREIFGDDSKLIRIDMSEFTESFSVSKLVGSPAGYVGYRDETLLTDKVRKNPYSVVLFDEIEKAHPQAHNILLQILDEGTLTDASGKKIDFSNTLIIITSNIGAQFYQNKGSLGFESNEKTSQEIKNQHISDLLSKTLNNELLNRIDHKLLFNTLNFQDLKKIAKIHIKDLLSRVENKEINLDIDTSVISAIAHKSNTEGKGARTIRQFIEQLIENPLAHRLIEHELSEKKKRKKIKISTKDNEIVFS